MAAQGGGLLSGFTKKLSEADSLKTSFTAGSVNGTPASYELALAKPNMARIETPNQLIIADGRQVLTYDKGSKTYYYDPQDATSIAGMMQDEALSFWAPFFNAKALDGVSTKAMGSKNRRGETFEVVEASFNGGKRKVNYYLDSSGLARMADISYSDTKDMAVLLTKSVTLGGVDKGVFTFNPPAGSRELTEEERFADKWFDNLTEALEVAKRTNKIVMVDFNAVWCGPCQKMKAEVFPLPEFKAYGKKMVFCEVDVDHNPALASKYGASAIPAIRFLKPDGSIVHKFEGYGNPAQVFGEMDAALRAAGK